MKALRFNPLNDDMEIREVETEFKVVSEFWVKAEPHGPFLIGEVWKDTEMNRHIISEIIKRKQAIKSYTDIMKKEIHEYMNKRER